MDSINNQPRWDAKRLVQEYLKKADLIKYYAGKPFGDIAWSNQIRIKRIASVLRAFLGLKGAEEKPLDLITSAFEGWGNEKIDDIIVLLLGDKFKQSFSEEELIANYGYPEETDAQLPEWDCDNY